MEMKETSERFGALSQETRIRLMRLLAAHHASGLAAGEIARELSLAPSTLSFHLSALDQAGLVQARRDGRRIIYTARLSALRGLFEFLTETCCQGNPALCGELTKLLPDDTEEAKAMSPAFNVLFLCTHNSARSIIAEAVLDDIGKGRFNAYSAGSDPVSAPMPEVLERLQIIGHDTSSLRSKSWEEFIGSEAPRIDFVIAMCDTLEGQQCPDFGDQLVTAAWPFPDPAKFSGSKTEHATMINAIYAMIRRRLNIFVNLPFATLDKMALKARLDEMGEPARLEM